MRRKYTVSMVLIVLLMAAPVSGQTLSEEELVRYTAPWDGERFEDGRPKVPDEILERMKDVSIENAWSVLRGHGYHNQFDGGWEMIHDERPVVGRALTAEYMPLRPDAQAHIQQMGEEAGRIGASNSWPIDMLRQGDVYVATAFGKIQDGTLIGNNLASTIYAKSGNGVGAGAAASAEAAPKPPVKRGGNVVKDDDIPLFSGHVVHGGLVYIAGKGAHYDGDVKQHTDTVLKKLEEELKEAGSSMEKVLKVNVYLADLADYDAMNEVFRGRFGENPPVRTTVATYGGMPGDSLVEIDCIAAL